MFKNPFAALKKIIKSDTDPAEATGENAIVTELTEKLRMALGGANNIVKSQSIAETRLLVTLRDNGLIHPEDIRGLGLNVFIPKTDGDVHVLVGLHPERFAAL